MNKKQLWEIFKAEELEDFSKLLGYGEKEIKKIGVKKFIAFSGWKTKEDLRKWRTDKVKIMPCQHCKSEFTTYQLDLGLCEKCKKEYDLKVFFDLVSGMAENPENLEAARNMQISFAFISEFREIFKKKSLEDVVKEFKKDGPGKPSTLGLMYSIFIGDVDTVGERIEKVCSCLKENQAEEIAPLICEIRKNNLFNNPKAISREVAKVYPKIYGEKKEE